MCIDWLLSDRLKNKIKLQCLKVYRLQEFDDAYQAYCLHILEGKGKKQSITQFFKDYSLAQKWYRRDGMEFQFMPIDSWDIRDWEIVEPKKEISEDLLKKLSLDSRIILMLRCKWGFTTDEIAEVYGLTPSYISQIVKNNWNVKRKPLKATESY